MVQASQGGACRARTRAAGCRCMPPQSSRSVVSSGRRSTLTAPQRRPHLNTSASGFLGSGLAATCCFRSSRLCGRAHERGGVGVRRERRFSPGWAEQGWPQELECALSFHPPPSLLNRPLLTCTLATYLPCCCRLSMLRICGGGAGRGKGRQAGVGRPQGASAAGGGRRAGGSTPSRSPTTASPAKPRHVRPQSGGAAPLHSSHQVGRHVGRVVVDDGPAERAAKHLDGLQARARANLRAGHGIRVTVTRVGCAGWVCL